MLPLLVMVELEIPLRRANIELTWAARERERESGEAESGKYSSLATVPGTVNANRVLLLVWWSQRERERD